VLEPLDDVVASEEELRALYPEPSERALRKELDGLDDHCRAFIAASPFFVLATADADGRCDASPRGGPPGFVRAHEGRLLVPDLPGNRRLDTHANVVANGHVGLLFMIPGMDETLRVNGTAVLSRDPAARAAATVEGRTPLLVLAVEVEQAYIHCGKAFRRSALWQPDSWPDRATAPSPARMLRDHANREVSVEEVEASLEEGYATRLYDW
jgi:uncharacterized protein